MYTDTYLKKSVTSNCCCIVQEVVRVLGVWKGGQQAGADVQHLAQEYTYHPHH